MFFFSSLFSLDNSSHVNSTLFVNRLFSADNFAYDVSKLSIRLFIDWMCCSFYCARVRAEVAVNLMLPNLLLKSSLKDLNCWFVF